MTSHNGQRSQRTGATLRIRRFNPDLHTEPYFDEFEIEFAQDTTLLDVLEEIKATRDGTLTFRRSCRHSICGSCGVNVNGLHTLACSTPVVDCVDAEGVITLSPLSSLPVIKDLVVDRGSFWQQYERVKPWLIPPAELPEREFLVDPAEVASYKNAETCIMCGVCYSACPVIVVDKGFVGPHAMLKAFLRVSDSRDSAHAEHMADIASVWDCTTCYACVDQCPKDLVPGHVSRDLRSILVEEGKVPRSIGTMLTSTFRNNNPFEMAHADRTLWAADLALPGALDAPVDTLYFTCCMACYDPRGQKSARALVEVFRAAGVKFGTLGAEEACCGSEVRRVGETGLFEMIVEERSALLGEVQAGQMTVLSPHCFDVYRHHYPELPYPVEHYSQQIARLIDEERLTFSRSLDKRVTYHDPCYLGIQNRVFEEPRAVLRSIPGVELVEMAHHHEASLCCGGGGGRMWFEGHDREAQIAHVRAREAAATGAQVLATACPFCLNMLTDAVKTLGLDDRLEVKDIAELVAEAL